ncbi:hypothetical protein R3P38DRAFT_3597666 [Favolaschia claudopus]|uniref:Transposase n=1 Tax=Favolaschia claudopus TaxID=2862362 RepID=A0AAW0ADQ9_9AGAR
MSSTLPAASKRSQKPHSICSCLSHDQQKALATKPVLDLIKQMRRLAGLLPDSVPEGSLETEDDKKIFHVTSQVHGIDNTVLGTFNRRFNILFGEDTRDNDGRLKYMRRGPMGMDLVLKYLDSIHWQTAQIPLDLAKLKLGRVVAELTYRCGNTAVASQTQGPKKKISDKAADPRNLCSDIFAASFTSKKKLKAAAKAKGKTTTTPGDESEEDRDYHPPKKARVISEDEEDDFSDSDTETLAAETGGKRKRLVQVDQDGVPVKPVKPRKAAKKHAKSNAASAAPAVEVIDVSSDDDQPTQGVKRGPKTNTREHYHPPIPVTHNGNRRWEFRCKHCPKTVTFPRTVDRAKSFEDEPKQPNLGNLATHLNRDDHGRDMPIPGAPEPGPVRSVTAASAKLMEEFLISGQLNPAIVPTRKGFLTIFSAWILEDDLPFTTGETSGIKRLFQYLKCKFVLPSDTAVRNTLARIFIDMLESLKADLEMVKSQIAVSTDTWTTCSMMFTFAGTIGSWITEDWELVERVLDFHPIEDKEHKGEFAAIGLATRLSELGVLEKISVVMDNVSANDCLMVALARILREKFKIHFVPDNSQIRCLAHVVNLVVQKILATFKEAADPKDDDYHDQNKDLPIHYDPEEDPEQLNLENEALDAVEDEVDLRLTNVKICSSPQRRREFRMIAQEIYKDKIHKGGRKIAALMVRGTKREEEGEENESESTSTNQGKKTQEGIYRKENAKTRKTTHQPKRNLNRQRSRRIPLKRLIRLAMNEPQDVPRSHLRLVICIMASWDSAKGVRRITDGEDVRIWCAELLLLFLFLLCFLRVSTRKRSSENVFLVFRRAGGEESGRDGGGGTRASCIVCRTCARAVFVLTVRKSSDWRSSVLGRWPVQRSWVSK